jgi:hypothetical protein
MKCYYFNCNAQCSIKYMTLVYKEPYNYEQYFCSKNCLNKYKNIYNK